MLNTVLLTAQSDEFQKHNFHIQQRTIMPYCTYPEPKFSFFNRYVHYKDIFNMKVYDTSHLFTAQVACYTCHKY